MIESLESRRLMTAVVLDDDGTLRITGTSGDERIHVSGDILHTLIQFGPKLKDSVKYPVEDVLAIVVHARAGNDRVNLYSGIPGVTVRGGEGGDTLWGSESHDRLIGGPGRDHLTGDIGDDTLVGGRGNDSFLDEHGVNTFRGGRGTDTVQYRDLDNIFHDAEIIERIDYLLEIPLTRSFFELTIAEEDDSAVAVLDFTFSDGGYSETVQEAVRDGKFITIEIKLEQYQGSTTLAIVHRRHVVELGTLDAGNYTLLIKRPDGSVVIAQAFNSGDLPPVPAESGVAFPP